NGGPRRRPMALSPELIEDLARMPDELARAVGQVPVSRLDWRPDDWGGAPGEQFPAREHVCHVRDIERLGYQVRIRRLLEEDRPSLVSLDGYARADERGYAGADLAGALHAFREARAATVALLRGLPDDALARAGDFAEYGPLTLRALVHYLRS